MLVLYRSATSASVTYPTLLLSSFPSGWPGRGGSLWLANRENQVINIQTTWRELAIIIANQLMKERAQADDKQEAEETGEEE